MKRSEEREQNIRRVIHTAQTLFIADGIAATPISCIARVVLEKADAHPEDGFARITHEEISHHLGTTREVISRELEGMRQMGLLRTGRGKIYVLDRPALEGMANL